jgi:hypothetical protein
MAQHRRNDMKKTSAKELFHSHDSIHEILEQADWDYADSMLRNGEEEETVRQRCILWESNMRYYIEAEGQASMEHEREYQ